MDIELLTERVPPLDDDNWLVWRTLVEAGLCLMGLDPESISSSPLLEESAAIGEQQAALQRLKDAQVLHVLRSLIGRRKQHLLEGHSSGVEAWAALRALYSAPDPARVLLLIDRLCTLSKRPGESVQAYMSRGHNIQLELNRRGEATGELHLLQCLLRGLPPEYAMVRTILHARPEALTYDAVLHALMAAESRMSASDDAPSAAGMGSAAAGGEQRPPRQQRQRRRRQKQQQQQHQQGHQAAEVPEAHTWVVASVAPSHMTPHRWLFSSYEPLPTPRLLYSCVRHDTPMQAVGTGTVTIRTAEGKQLHLHDVLHVPGLSRNLLSAKTAASRGFTVRGTGDVFVIMREDEVLVRAPSAADDLFTFTVTYPGKVAPPLEQRRSDGDVGGGSSSERGSKTVFALSFFDAPPGR